MKVTFYASDKPREIMLAQALAEGVKVFGDELEIRRTGEYGEDEGGNDLRWAGPSPDTEVACVFGVKGRSRQIMRDHRALSRATLYFDKGYTRDKGEGGHTLYSRVSVNDSHPLAYAMREKRPNDRLNRLGLKFAPRAPSSSGHVLLCTSSQKYCDFHELGDEHRHAATLVGRLRKVTSRQIVYRPKPSWSGAKPVAGAAFSSGAQSMVDALRGCHCVVTHGATAAMDAVIAGIPAVVLGQGIARPVAESEIDKVDAPFWPDDKLRGAWARAMAYCQWTTEELRSGEAWEHLRAEIVRQQA